MKKTNKKQMKFYRIASKLDNKDFITHYIKETDEWEILNYYEDDQIFFSEYNLPILSSNKNTFKDLKKFVKKHRKTNYTGITSDFSRICVILVWVIAIINIFFIKDVRLKYIGLTIQTTLIVSQMVLVILEALYFDREMKNMNYKIKNKNLIKVKLIEDKYQKQSK